MEVSPEEIKISIKKGKLIISVYGLGWMGLPTACLFAEAGAMVIGVDIDPRVIELIQLGESPVEEPNLQAMLKNYINNRIRVTNNLREAASQSNIIVIVIPTLIDDGGKPDYSALEKATKEIGLKLNKGSIIIIESTVGLGITETVVKESLETSSGFKAGTDFGLAYSPIRAMAGKTLNDLRSYPRIVGGIDYKSLEIASAVLESIVSGGIVKVKNIRTAEAIKLFENVYRDVNIALANELAMFSEKARLDFKIIKEAANTQPYCHLHEAGIGVGGHCIPFNPYFLIEAAEELGVEMKLVKDARKINDSMPNHTALMITKALRSCKKNLKRSKIAILGLSYRANVKEAKLSPSHEIIKMLLIKGAKVSVYDPYFKVEELENMGLPSTGSLERSIDSADCVFLAVGHDEFKRLKLENIIRALRKPACIVDGCQIFSSEEIKGKGVIYYGIGRGSDAKEEIK